MRGESNGQKHHYTETGDHLDMQQQRLGRIDISFDGNGPFPEQLGGNQARGDSARRDASVGHISEEDQQVNLNSSQASAQYVLVEGPQEILPQKRKLKLHEISKTGIPVYQVDKAKPRKQKHGEVFMQVQKVKLSKGIV